MITNPRELALTIILDINENNSFSNLTISKQIPDTISSQDESFIRELVYGVLENKTYIDYILSKASKIKITKLHPAIRDILRLGIYQLVFMDRVPQSAAVNESVNLAKQYGHKGTVGFANGVLRSIGRDIENFSKIETKDKSQYLSIKYSHPEFLVNKWLEEYGYEFTEELLIANNSKPSMNIRVNTLMITKENLKKRLENTGYTVKEGLYARDCLIIDKPYRITSLAEFKEGYFTIQDESSMLVGQILNPKENSLVLDVCSAPGGKSTHIAQLMNNKGKILARDIYQHKIQLMTSNIERLGIKIIECSMQDALEIDESLIGKIDYTLVDAPCSGLGLIRRKPEIKWNRKVEDIVNLVKLQSQILQNASKYVKHHGVLIYSTCTILKEENIDVVKEFLSNNPEFELVPILEEMDYSDNIETLKDGYLQLYPHIHFVDGFFIAKMVKQR